MSLSLEQMKANRKLWVEALRSGKYKQGKGELRNKDRFCCLGVACDVFGVEWHRGRPVGWDSGSGGLIPRSVAEHFGLSLVEHRTGDWYLAVDNDNGKSFAQLAAIIESEPEGLFAESVLP